MMLKGKMTTKQLADEIGVTDDYIRHLIIVGKLKAEKLGRMWLINRRDTKGLKRVRVKKGTPKNG